MPMGAASSPTTSATWSRRRASASTTASGACWLTGATFRIVTQQVGHGRRTDLTGPHRDRSARGSGSARLRRASTCENGGRRRAGGSPLADRSHLDGCPAGCRESVSGGGGEREGADGGVGGDGDGDPGAAERGVGDAQIAAVGAGRRRLVTARPRPAPPASRARPSSSRTKRRTTSDRWCSRDARPVVVDIHANLAVARTATVMRTVPVAWRAALATRWSTARRTADSSPTTGGTPADPTTTSTGTRAAATPRRAPRRRATTSPPARRDRARARRRGRAAAGRRRGPAAGRARAPAAVAARMPVRVDRPSGDLELGAHHGDRRAQLVRGVGHELAARRRRRLEPAEHPVHRACQLGDLVRRCGLPAPARAASATLIAATRDVTACTGRSARPARIHASPATSATSAGPIAHSSCRVDAERVAHSVERRRRGEYDAADGQGADRRTDRRRRSMPSRRAPSSGTSWAL